MSTVHSKIMMYKPGTLDRKGLRDLKKAGYTCVEVRGLFSDVQFRMVDGLGIEDHMGDMQVMILKAALESYSFSDKLGKIVAANLQRKLKAAEQSPQPSSGNQP